MRFEIGDVVKINCNSAYAEAIGRIVYIDDLVWPIWVRFISLPGHLTCYFNMDDLIKLSDKEALAWLI